MRAGLILLAGLVLAGCGRQTQADPLAQLDRELADANDGAPARDPALNAALRDQIMVDPALAQQSNADAVRPPSRPDPLEVPPADVAAAAGGPSPPADRPAPAPRPDPARVRAAAGALTLGALAERQPDRRTAGCAARVRYSAAWANRLPPAAPLFPDARVVEAAGTDEAGCSLRVVSYASGASVGRLVDFYHARATAAGYSAEHLADGGTHVVGGTRGDSAYAAYLRPRAGGGTDVDLLAN